MRERFFARGGKKRVDLVLVKLAVRVVKLGLNCVIFLGAMRFGHQVNAGVAPWITLS